MANPLDAASRQAKYLRLYEELRTEIASGAHRAGAPLPPVKRIMSSRKVSQTTAMKAIEMLEAGGLVTRRAGVGVFVASPSEEAATEVVVRPGWATAVVAEGMARRPAGMRLDDRAEIGAADVVHMTPLSSTDMVRGGKLAPLDPFLRRDPAVLEGLHPEAVKLFEHGGAQYGLPVYIAPLCAHLNLDLFARAGVAPPGPDWGVADLLRLGRDLRRAGIERPLAWARDITFLFPLLRGEGARPYDAETARMRLDTPEMRQALGRMREIVEVCGEPLGHGEGRPDAKLVQGQAAIAFWGAVPRAASLPLRHTVAPLPRGERVSSLLLAEGLGIPVSCRHPDAAWKALKRFVSPEASETLVRAEVMFPPRHDGLLSFLATHDPSYAWVFRRLSSVEEEQRRMGADRMAILGKAFEGWWRPDVDAAALLARAQGIMDAVMSAAHVSHDA